MDSTTNEGNTVNEVLDTASRNRREDGRYAPRATLHLAPVYRWLIVTNAVLSGAWLALDLVATARGR